MQTCRCRFLKSYTFFSVTETDNVPEHVSGNLYLSDHIHGPEPPLAYLYVAVKMSEPESALCFERNAVSETDFSKTNFFFYFSA